MAIIKLVEDYAVTQLRRDVRDSLTLAGEQAIILSLFHAGDKDAVRCSQCGDDIYKSAETDCTICYGTNFEGGVRYAMRVWSLFTDQDKSEQIGPRGIAQPDQRSVTFEGLPMVTEHDVLVRVKGWAANGTPSVLEGYYLLQKIQRRSLRTGTRFGQASWDVVSQKAQLASLPTTLKMVTQYPVLGKVFQESIQVNPTSTPPSAVVLPDTKVVYVPIQPAPGGPVVVPGGEDAFSFVQALPATIWTIEHALGYKPTVTILINDEVAEAEVDHPTNNVTVITFATPQAGTARLT